MLIPLEFFNCSSCIKFREIAGGIQSLRAEEKYSICRSAIMSAAAVSTVETDYAAETAILTKYDFKQDIIIFSSTS